MGEVYRVDDLKLKQSAALKMLPAALSSDRKLLESLLNEARQARQVTHPNVCRVHDVDDVDGVPFLTMEFIEGEDLGGLIRRIGRLPRDKAFELGKQLCEGVQAGHKQGVLHLDLKPANLMIDEKGELKIADFGLARLAVDARAEHRVAGTPAYMAPEQMLHGEASEKCDIYAIGLILLEMLTGRRAKVAQGIEGLREFHEGEGAIEIPPEFTSLLGDCLASSPANRLGEVTAILDRLVETSAAGQGSSSIDAHPGASAGSASPEKSLDALPPEALRDSDVVIAYAGLDDQPVIAGHEGWVSQLHENLRVRVAQLSGKEVAVVKLPDAAASAEMDSAMLREVPQAKTVVSVLSPPFAQSGRCQKVVETFWEQTQASGRFEVEERSRLLNVVKTPVEVEDLPSGMRSLYNGLAPYEFFERDAATGRMRQFDEAFGEVAVQRFHERIYDVAYDLSQVLKHLGDVSDREGHRSKDPKTVFLATTTSDLEPQRDQLRRELIEMGHDVIPKQPLPLVASDLTVVVRECLERADIAIHLVGEHFGFVPEATELSVVALQNQIAARYCSQSPLRRLIWMQRGLEISDQRQASFLHQLETDPAAVTGAELIADNTLDNLKVLVLSRWEKERLEKERASKPTAAQDVQRLYLICDQKDESSVEPLEDFFFEQGIEVSLPAFDLDESETQQIHLQNLTDCDAVLIYYGAANMHWVDFKTRDLQKAAGYRDGRPIPFASVYLAPPFDRRKERFKTMLADVARQGGDSFEPSLLTEFVASIKRGEEAEA